MSHHTIRNALKDADGFNRLHDRTAKDVTLFYLHAEAVSLHWEDFNRRFMELLGIEEQAEIPCMVFFRSEERRVGKECSVRVDLGGRRRIKKKKKSKYRKNEKV